MHCLSLSKKSIYRFYFSCGSTHKIEFAEQIHKFREHGPDHPLLPLCGNSPCVSRNLYKGRKNVSAGRGFSSRFARKRGFEREAARKTEFFDSLRSGTFLFRTSACQKSGKTTFLTSCKHFNCVKMLLISRKGNPDGSLSNYPSLRILWAEGLFDSLKPRHP